MRFGVSRPMQTRQEAILISRCSLYLGGALTLVPQIAFCAGPIDIDGELDGLWRPSKNRHKKDGND